MRHTRHLSFRVYLPYHKIPYTTIVLTLMLHHSMYLLVYDITHLDACSALLPSCMYACAVRDASAFLCIPLVGSSYDHTARNRYRNNRYSVLRTLVSATYILVRSTCTEVPSYLEGMIAVWPGNMRGASYYLTLTVKILFHNVPTSCYSGM